MTDIYLDNASTTRVCPECAELAIKVMTEQYGNPSSTHTKGREAAAVLKKAREQVALAIGAKPQEIYFTSCGTESDNWALLEGAYLRRHEGKHIISSLVEHDAVRQSLNRLESEGYEITRLRPLPDGSISEKDVLQAIRKDTILISLMMVNNETGAVTDVSSIAKKAHKINSRILFHTDAVQGFMKVPFSAKKTELDMISVSGHKIHAPKGVGALYIRNGIKLPGYIIGGSQENGYRAGTESLPLIASFGLACEIAFKSMSTYTNQMHGLKEQLICKLHDEIPEISIISSIAPHILSVSLPGWRSEVLMNYLESKGIFVSRSSACKKGARSHVLEAMELDPKVIDGTIRVSLSRYTTEEECSLFVQSLKSARDELSHHSN